MAASCSKRTGVALLYGACFVKLTLALTSVASNGGAWREASLWPRLSLQFEESLFIEFSRSWISSFRSNVGGKYVP